MELGDRLLTLIHISDLHFGVFDANGDAEDNPLLTQIYSLHPIFDGFLGHHATALVALEAFFRSLRDEKPRLLMSGDSTRVARDDSFQNAEDYLSGLVMIKGLPCGLNQPGWADDAIPGNHDHWPGTGAIWGGPNHAAFNGHYRHATPDVIDVPLLSGTLLLRIGIINTDAEVHPNRLRRLLAVGHFRQQLIDLRNVFRPPPGPDGRPEIRVLMMHHSPAMHRGMMGISHASMNELRSVLNDLRIQVVLTGHLHQALIDKNAAGVPNVVECRCGTTTQMEYARPSWIQACAHLTSRLVAQNALFVHRLYRQHEGTIWDAQCYVRNGGSFTTCGLNHAFYVA